MDLRATVIVLLFVVAPLAGCADAPSPESTSGTSAPPPAESTARIHRTLPDENGTTIGVNATLEDWARAAGDAPLPRAEARYPGHDGFEPTLGVDSAGNVFLGTWDFWVEDIARLNLVSRSTDQGATWTDVTPEIGPATYPPDSNDPYVYVDPDTDRIFLFNLHYLACMTLAFSDDGGDSWTFSPIACGQPLGGQDHQTLWTSAPTTLQTVGYPNVVHYCVNRVADTACAFSLDGGLTWSPLRPAVFTGLDPANVGTNSTNPPFGLVESATRVCGGLTGHGASGPDGAIYLPKGHCGIPTVAVSHDDGLTWEAVAVSTDRPMGPAVRCCEPFLPATVVTAYGHEVAVAVDDAGNVFAMWIAGDDLLPYLAASTDGGATWGPAVPVAPPGVRTADFPTLAAGADGRVAAVYYGTEADTGPAYEDTPEDARWNAYMTIVLNATDPDPVMATTTANDPDDPVAVGACGGTRCPNDYGVGDFIDVVIGPDGRVWAALVDACLVDETGKCPAPSFDDRSQVFAGVLSEGPALRGPVDSLAALPPAPTTEAQ